jgi:hypothetical protein
VVKMSVLVSRVVGISVLVVRYFQALLTVTNTHVSGQPVEVCGGKGRQPSNSTYGLFLPPCPFHLPCPSYCDVAQVWRYLATSIRTSLRGIPTQKSNININSVEISGSHGGEYEDDSLLGYCAM